MNYLLDRKSQKKKFSNLAFWIVLAVLLIYFRTNIFNGLAYVSGGIFRPVLIVGNVLGEKMKSFGSYFALKNSLYQQNQDLQAKLSFDEARMNNYDSVLAENAGLKEILGRKNTKVNMILASILAKPNQSLYDTLIIDIGTKDNIKIGNTVFALGDVPIGRIDTVYDHSAKVVLFSNAGEKTQVNVSLGHSPTGEAVKNISMEIVGRGGGNFEMILPRDFVLQKGEQVTLPGINPYVLAITETVISDPRDPFIKALLRSTVNVQELKFVEVAI